MSLRRLASVVAVLVVVASLPGARQRVAAVTAWSVVASGLDNPRGLTFGPDGALYVAEAGEGGTKPCYDASDDTTKCIGPTGAVTRIWRDDIARVVDDLPSASADGGNFASGPQDVSLLGNGNLFVTIGLGADPANRPTDAPGPAQGTLVRVTRNGGWKVVADVAAFEASHDPNNDGPDSNPYGLLAEAGRTLLTDAGGNALLAVDAAGRISTLAVFPNRDVPAPPFIPAPFVSMDAVPTSITHAADGWYYISQLTGFPFPVGDSRIFRWRSGTNPEVYCAGLTSLTNVIDMAAGPSGSLYVLEIFTNGLLSGDLTGRLVRVGADCSQTTIVDEGLTAPTSVAVGPDGALYVSNNGVFANAGEVLRIVP
jgi:hypothetical protein